MTLAIGHLDALSTTWVLFRYFSHRALTTLLFMPALLMNATSYLSDWLDKFAALPVDIILLIHIMIHDPVRMNRSTSTLPRSFIRISPPSPCLLDLIFPL